MSVIQEMLIADCNKKYLSKNVRIYFFTLVVVLNVGVSGQATVPASDRPRTRFDEITFLWRNLPNAIKSTLAHTSTPRSEDDIHQDIVNFVNRHARSRCEGAIMPRHLRPEDIASEIFVKLQKPIDSEFRVEHPHAYLKKAIDNLVIDKISSMSGPLIGVVENTLRLHPGYSSDNKTPLELLDDARRWAITSEFINEVITTKKIIKDRRSRKAWEMKYLLGIKASDEIATILNRECRPGDEPLDSDAVKLRIFRANTKVKNELARRLRHLE